MPLSAASEPPSPPLPAPLAEQLALIQSRLAVAALRGGDELLGHLDSSLFNICDLAEVDFAILNRTLAFRAAAERYAQALDDVGPAARVEREEARSRVEEELSALEEVLREAQPGAMIRAMGGWS